MDDYEGMRSLLAFIYQTHNDCHDTQNTVSETHATPFPLSSKMCLQKPPLPLRRILALSFASPGLHSSKSQAATWPSTPTNPYSQRTTPPTPFSIAQPQKNPQPQLSAPSPNHQRTKFPHRNGVGKQEQYNDDEEHSRDQKECVKSGMVWKKKK